MGENAQSDGALMEVCVNDTELLAEPGFDAAPETELLRGERFRVAEKIDGWVRGTAEIDGYTGYVAAFTLNPAGEPPTHQVVVRSTRLYREPDARAKAGQVAWFGSQLALHGVEQDGFIETNYHSWVPAAHVVEIGTRARDFAAFAERLIGAPYRYGGRTPNGLDCSALVQLALQAAGMPCPRDSGPQFESLGIPLAPDATLQRGDLAFWPGHVGILLDAHTLLHANAYHMTTATEPFAEAVRRIESKGLPLRGNRRLATSARPENQPS